MTRAPTAQQRTISLFTGKTDTEQGGGAARDGSVVEPPSRSSRLKRALRWTGGITRWHVNVMKKGKAVETHSIERKSDGYHAWAYGRKLGVFATIFAACDACEVA